MGSIGTHRSQWIRFGIAAAVVAVVVALPGAAHAAEPGYAAWSDDGAGGYRMSSPAAGFPAGTLTTDSSSTQIQSGRSAWLGEDTPFGAEFGSSQDQGYLGLRTAAGITPSTTVLTFDEATPADRWGFTLGDIDVDEVQISGTGADGGAVSIADLGHQSSFNYCQNSPRPSSCRSAATDQPTWDPAAGTLAGTNSGDTDGASGWFMPTVPLSSITFAFTDLSGIPAYQLWIAAEAHEVEAAAIPVSVPVEPGDASGSVGQCDEMDGEVTLELRYADGTPVLDEDGAAVTAFLDDQGEFHFDRVFPGSYQVAIIADEDYPVSGADVLDVAVGDGDVSGLEFSVECVADSRASPAADDSASNDAASDDSASDDAGPVLPTTGPAATALWTAAALLIAGAGLTVATRMSRNR